MRKLLMAASTLVGGILVCAAIAGDEEGKKRKSPSDGQGDRQATAEAEIHAAAKDFAAAFNRGSAKDVAAHWTSDGEYINEMGLRLTATFWQQREEIWS